MRGFAVFMAVFGGVMALLSAVLMGYAPGGSAPYVLCQFNIAIGVIMLALGIIYLVVKRDRQK